MEADVARKSPQEKKRLSYLKDRRNNYGENDKSSRTSIRARKRAVNSANRRREQLALAQVGTSADTGGADVVELNLHRQRPKSWRKVPDAPLGAVVAGGLERRVRVGIDEPARAEQRIHKVRTSVARQG
jgi:hypothetical protein